MPALRATRSTTERCGAEFSNRDVERGNTKMITITKSSGSNFNSAKSITEFAIFLQILSFYHPYWHNTMLDTIRVRQVLIDDRMTNYTFDIIS